MAQEDSALMTEITPGPGWWKATDGQWYPPRWEYTWVQGYLNPKKGHEPIELALEEHGLQGWEAVSYSGGEHAAVSTAHVMVLMKRPLVR